MAVNFPLSFTAFLVLFNLIYFSSWFLFVKVDSFGFNRAPKSSKTKDADNPRLQAAKAACRITALVHSSLMIPFLISYIYHEIQSTNPNFTLPLLNYVSHLTAFESRLLSWSCAYFMQDMLHYIIFEPNDKLMLAHHIVSLLFYASVKYLNLGGLAMCVALITGECTNPLQSIWFLAKIGSHVKLYDFISPIFTVSFVFVRTLIVPVWVYDIIANGFVPAARSGKLPVPYAVGWSAMCLIMTVGSLLWSYQLVLGFIKRYYNKKFRETAKSLPEVKRLS